MPESTLFYSQYAQDEEQASFPKVSDLVNDDRFKKMSAVRKAYSLGQYRNKLAQHLLDTGEVTNQQEFDAATVRINEAVNKHMPSGNSMKAIFSSSVDRKEILAELTGLVATARMAGRSAKIKEDFRSMAIAQSLKGDNSSMYIPREQNLEDYVKKYDSVYNDFEDMRNGLEIMISEDKDIQGRNEISAQGLSASTLGNAASRIMAVDIPLAIGSAFIAGPAGPLSYYTLTSAASSDRALRQEKPDMSTSERFSRSVVTGAAVGSAEMVGFGYITNSQRALKLTKAMDNILPEAVRKIGGAAIAEGSTEFAQTYLEHFGHNVEAFDDFIQIASDEKVFNEALISAGVGSILGGGIRGGIDVSTKSIEAVIKTDAYKNALKKLDEVKSKVDWKEQFNQPINDVYQSVLDLTKKNPEYEAIAGDLQTMAENAQDIKATFEGGEFDPYSVPKELPPQEQDVVLLDNPELKGEFIRDGKIRYSQDDILTNLDIIKQEGKTAKVEPKSQKQAIRDIVLEVGGIKEDSFHKDAIRTPEGRLTYSPKFKAKQDGGMALDQIKNILVQEGHMREDDDINVIIEAIQGTKKEIAINETTQPDEDFDVMEEDGIELEDGGIDPVTDYFDRGPGNYKSKGKPKAQIEEQPRLFNDLPKEVKVNELPLSLSDLTRLSVLLHEKPTKIKKLLDRNGSVQGVYSPAHGIALKASLAAGPQIASFPKNTSREKIVKSVMADEDVISEFPDIKEEDIIILDVDSKLTVHKRDHDYAARIFAHEIGHNIDDIDAKDIEAESGIRGRGNLIGRLKGVKNFLEPKVMTSTGEIKNSVIRKELKALTHWWKPFNKFSDPKYTSYRYSGPELYADAMSVLFNAPNELASRAPQFYQGIQEFMGNKPEIKEMYDGLVERRKNGETAKENLKFIYNMMSKAGVTVEDLTAKNNASDILTFLKEEVIDSKAQQYRYKRKNKLDDKIWNQFVDAHSDFLHSSAMANGYLIAQRNFSKELKESGFTQEDFDTFMFLNLTENERKDYFNSGGIRAQESTDTLSELKNKIGDVQFEKLNELQEKFNNVREIAKKAFLDSGLFTEALENKIKSNKNYVKFNSVDKKLSSYFHDSGAVKIFKIVGSLRELKSSPYFQTISQDMTLMQMAYRNIAKKTMVNDLILPNDRIKAVRDKSGNYKPYEGKDKSLFAYLDKGKLKGFYIDSDLARLYDGSVTMSKVVNYSSKIMKPFKALWVTGNAAFAVGNVPRDFAIGWKQLSSTFTDRNVVLRPFLQGYALAKTYVKVLPEVLKSTYLDKHSDYILNMQIEGKLPSGDPSGLIPGMETMSDSEKLFIKKLGVVAEDRSKLNKIINSIIQFIPNIGKSTELLVKRAGDEVLTRNSNLSKNEIKNLVRWFGSPDFIEGGSLRGPLSATFMFSNANVVGHRQALSALRRDPAGYLFKTAIWNVIPRALAAAALYGWLGDDLEEWFNKVDKNDLKHTNIIPLNLFEEGADKAKYVRIAQDHMGATVSQMLFGALEQKPKDAFNALFDMNPYDGDSLNPMGRITLEFISMFQDRSPVDHYGNQVIDRDLLGTDEGWIDFARYEFNSVFASQFKLTTKEDLGFSKIPIITSLVDRIYKETDVGELQSSIDENKEKSKAKALFIDKYIDSTKNGLTKIELRREANMAYNQMKNREVNKSSFIRSFETRYRKTKVVK
jgi:hypothetical protein